MSDMSKTTATNTPVDEGMQASVQAPEQYTGQVPVPLDYKKITDIIAASVPSAGWKRIDTGASAKIDYNYRFDLYMRRRNLACLVGQKEAQNDDLLKKSSNQTQSISPEKPVEIKASEHFPSTVSKGRMGGPNVGLTPSTSMLLPVTRGNEHLPVLSNFSNYPSLTAIKSDSPALVIAYDSEWYYPTGDESDGRIVLTWQFSVISGEDLVEYIFVRKMEKYGLTLELAFGRILDSLGLTPVDNRKVRRYEAIVGKDETTGNNATGFFNTMAEAKQNSIRPFPDDGRMAHYKNDWSLVDRIPIVLLCHAGKADISALCRSDKKYERDQKPREPGKEKKKVDYRNYFTGCSEVQGGIVTLHPKSFYAQSVKRKYASNNNIYTYPIILSVRDTMCHAPGKMKSLQALGETVGWEKILLDEGCIKHMDQFLKNDPCAYFEYAANDSNVTLLYESALYGYNNNSTVTLMSATAKIMRDVMMKYLGCENTKQFDRKYRGLEKVKHGLVRNEDGPAYTGNSSLEPISDKANTVQYYASMAYHGGYNSCSDVGYFPRVTFDYDLQNAYPTAQCLVPDVDWENPIRSEIANRELTLQDFVVPIIGGYAPLTMMLAYVRFEFPPRM